MKTRVIAVALALTFAGAVVPAVAQTDTPPSEKVQELRQQFLEQRAEVLSQILEKRAELVRLSAQKDPDIERVQALVREIAELRDQQQKKCAEYRATMAVVGRQGLAPLGRPGAGGMGLGPGAGYGRRRDVAVPDWRPPRRGLGYGRGDAGRRGPGDAWAGRGPRRGRGPAFGPGQGAIPSPWRGAGRRAFPGPGRGRQGAQGIRPWGPGRFFLDRDNDGVCDYWQGWANPPAPPAVPAPAEAEEPADLE